MIDNMAGDGRKDLRVREIGLNNESAPTETRVEIFVDDALAGGG
jgi:hypothetical protein